LLPEAGNKEACWALKTTTKPNQPVFAVRCADTVVKTTEVFTLEEDAKGRGERAKDALKC
jgi:hypothetical protein